MTLRCSFEQFNAHLIRIRACHTYPLLIAWFIWLLFGSCKAIEKSYKYRLVYLEGASDGKVFEVSSSSFVCFGGKLFEFETVQRSSSLIDPNGTELSKNTSVDTVGLYLLQPDLGRYFRFNYKNRNYVFFDSGRLHNKVHGYNFDYSKSQIPIKIELSSLKDTSLEGESLQLYKKSIAGVDIGKSLMSRYYFSTRKNLKTILTYGNANRFIGVGDIYRFELVKDSVTFIFSVQDLTELSLSEIDTFRKIIFDVNGML
jgi:hypothetical protein